MALTFYTDEDTTITAEKAAAVRRINAMQVDGWQALESMTDSELDAFEKEVDGASVLLDYGHPHNEARSAAYKAINRERGRRYSAARDRRRLQETRYNNVNQAVELIERATKLIEDAHNIELEPGVFSRSFDVPDVDVANASDSELAQTFDRCQAILSEHHRDAAAFATCILMLKCKAARAIANELKAEAKTNDDRQAKARELLNLIAAERERRESERHAATEALKPENMAARITELEQALKVGD